MPAKTLLESESATDALQRVEALLLSAQRRTEEFLATLGHEMRNPLSAISNALEVWPTHDPAQMDELRRLMQRQVVQLIHLSDDLLDVARITQGKLELRLDPVELGPILRNACEEVRPFID